MRVFSKVNQMLPQLIVVEIRHNENNILNRKQVGPANGRIESYSKATRKQCPPTRKLIPSRF